MTRNYLTACRDYQLPVLLASMRKHCGDFRLHVLAWDFDPHDWSCLGPDVKVITREAFLVRHPDYAPDRLPGPPRLTISQLDTARWRVMADLLSDGLGPVTYVDGDQWFFSSPEPAFAEAGDARMAVSPHRIPPAALGLQGVILETHRKYGLYNSGFVYVAAREPAEAMAAACYEWCSGDVIPRPGGGWLFGDQGYLEPTAEKFGAHVFSHPGLNIAPWNAHAHRLARTPAGFTVDGEALVSWHFSSLKPGGQDYNRGYDLYLHRDAQVLADIYAAYRAAMAEQAKADLLAIGRTVRTFAEGMK